MQATFDESGEIQASGAGAAPKTAEGLGGKNIKGVNDKLTQVEADLVGKEPKLDDPITTGRQPRTGYDPGSESVATIDDPGRGNVKTAAGSVTTGGREDKLIPGQD